ncbi:MAG TPA: 30S ribosomal protein S12 methylthiotransferase RimO [Candidatus Faecalibacterium intestinipullorum]|nr:30S ribosomal protein S12 methylthiotransferase RimO [Candidatus Faecalibacterium intestinipullorum]
MKIACISLGCPKNQVDLDCMVHTLLAAGHETVADLSEADVALVNTCGFIESAKAEAIENILEACACKEQNPNLKVVVTGCLAERYRSQIREEIPEVDAVVGCASNGVIDSIVARVTGGEQLESYGPKKEFPLGGKRVIGTPAHYAYLKIAEGCNNRCHYCAIPLIRGPLRSRPLEDCVAEARWLASEGVKELIVVAQDPTAYGEDWGQPGSICELLDRLNEIEGIEWIRIMYAYPERITDKFIAAMQRNKKVVPYLDLPIQHCNDEILHNMNRRSTRAELLEVIGRLRAAIPGITLRTTLIAGFPGETEAQFEELCQFVKEVQFDRLGCFAYSAEENTLAARMEGQLDQETKDRRAELVMQIQTGIMSQKQAAKVGQTVRALCDGIDEESGLYLCRTAGDAPEVDGCVCVSSETPLYPGEFYTIRVEESDLYDLYGVVEEK